MLTGLCQCDVLNSLQTQLIAGARTWSISFTKARLFEICLKAGLLEVGIVRPLMAFDKLRKVRAARQITSECAGAV